MKLVRRLRADRLPVRGRFLGRGLGFLAACLVLVAIAAMPGEIGDSTADRVLGQSGFTNSQPNFVDGRGLNSPYGVAIDRSVTPNRVYVADLANNRVLAWNDTSSWTNGAAADAVIGQPNFFTSDCNPGLEVSASGLCNPQGVAVDPWGNLYVADAGNMRVVEYDNPLGTDHVADRVFGQISFSASACNNNSGGPSASGLCYPTAVAVDGSGNLYVNDSNNQRVLEYDSPLGSDTVADRVFGQSTFTTRICNDGGVSGSTMCFPTGVAVDGAGNLYVVDSYNHRVLEYDAILTSDAVADRVFGQSTLTDHISCSYPRSASTLCNPFGVTTDVSGNLYVSDYGANRVLEYDNPIGSDRVAERVFGQANFTTNACDSGVTGLCNPRGLAVDATGALYVADSPNNRVLKYESALSADSIADKVLGQLDFAHITANLVDGRGFNNPRSVAIDRSVTPNRVYVADTDNNRVLAWSNAGAWTNGAPADTVIGQPDFLGSTCNNGGLSASSLCSPQDVAVDAVGNVYVADSGNARVVEYDDPLNTDRVADRVIGQADFTTSVINDGGVSASSLYGPQGVALDAAGNLYVADGNNHRVLEYDDVLHGDAVADRVFGQPDLTTSGCNVGSISNASASSLCNPYGVAVDAAGNLYVSDQANSRVLEYDNALATDAVADRVFGQSNFTDPWCNNYGLNASSLCNPYGLALDAAGNLYVADYFNHRVVEYDQPLGGDTAGDRVFGQYNFQVANCNYDGEQTGPSAGALCNPADVAVDSSGNVYVADSANHRVLKYDQPLATTMDFGDAPAPYPTLRADNGARHRVGSLYLGSAIDADADGQPDAAATGDDAAGASNDEDGVTFGTWRASRMVTITVVVTGGPGKLDAWVDFNQNGSWYDYADQIFSGQPVSEGVNSLSVYVPYDAVIGDTFARFRLSSAGVAGPTGDAPDGEVEDYKVTIHPSDPTISVTPSDIEFPNQVVGSTSTSQTVTVTNTGTLPETMSGISSWGSDTDDFPLVNNCGGVTLAPGDSCTVDVRFAPTASSVRHATLSVGSGWGQQVTLSGNGVDAFYYLQPSPSSVDFGSQPVGTTSSTQAVTLTNYGNVDVTVNGFTAGGDDPTDFAVVDDGCSGQVLAVNATCTVTLAFTPDVAGNRSATEVVSTYPASPGTPTSFALSGVGVAAGVALNPGSVSFADQTVGTASLAQSVTLTNSGNSTLTLTSINVAGDFSQSNDCGLVIYPGAGCTISVTFSPTATGNRGGSVMVVSNAPTSPDSVGLSGTGVQPAMSTTGRVDLGNQLVGTTSAVQTLTVTNTGTTTLNVGTPEISGYDAEDFSLVSNGCTSGVAPNASCAIGVTFHPSAIGGRTAVLSIPTNAPNSPASVALSGTGIQAAMSTTGPIDFGGQVVGNTSSTQTVTVTNTGTATLNVGAVSLIGTNSGDFTIVSNGCTSAVEPNAQCSIGLTFHPSATGGRSASLSIPSNAPNSPSSVALAGNGTQAALSTSGPVSFANQVVGTTSAAQTITVTNSGTATLSVGAPSLSGTNAGDFSGVSNGCTSGIAPGASCSISVEFHPSATGGRSATLSIPSNAPNSPASVALAGTGIQAALSTSGPIDFGNQVVGGSSSDNGSSYGVLVRNIGTSTLNVGTPLLTGANAGDFSIVANSCTSGIAPGASCVISLTFHPSVVGPRSASLSIPSNAPDSPASVTLGGIGTQPVLSTSGSVDFGGNLVGTNNTLFVTVTNSGTATLYVGAPSVSGPNAGDFSVSPNNCTYPVQPNASCSVSVTFSPSATGARSATLSLPSNAPNSPASVALSGTGTQPALSTSGPVDFGAQLVGTADATQTVIVSNSGSSTLNVGTLSLNGANAADFTINSNSCTNVAPGNSCSIGLTFHPSSVGAKSATVVIPSNAPNSPASVALAGTGIQAALDAPSSVLFGSQRVATTSATQTLTVTNSGTATLNVGTLSLGGANAAEFSIVSNGCTASVAPNASCVIGLSFHPSATGARSAIMSIPSNAPNGPASVALSGTGIQPALSASGSLNFGDQVAGTTSAALSVTVTNAGTATLNVGLPSLIGSGSGEFSIVSNGCTTGVAPNATCVISVTFHPSIIGGRSASLSIPSDAPNSPASVPVSGNGTARPDALSASEYITVKATAPTQTQIQNSARLIDELTGQPVANRVITFSANGSAICQATTDASGTANCSVTVNAAVSVVLGNGYRADFAGDSVYAPASANAAVLTAGI